MEKCNCSSTVKSNWGSEKKGANRFICNFCGKEQSSSDVLLEINSSELPPKIQDAPSPINWEKKSTLEKALDSGSNAALRVFKFGTLFETIGNVLQWINAIAATLLIFLILFTDLVPGYIKLVSALFVGLIWGLSFLQTSLIRGLASYFQMRASDYLRRK